MVAQSDWLPMIRPTRGRRLTEVLAIRARISGDDVGDELAFQLQNLVLEPELALSQALQLELVERRFLDQAVDHLVEVAMLAFQRCQLGLDRVYIQRFRSLVVVHAGRPRSGGLATSLRAVYPFGRPKGST